MKVCVMIEFQTTTNLLPHQQHAIDKVIVSRVNGLFMEMGTGKTRTAIELAHRRQGKYDKVVWLSPVSIKENTKREWLKHTNVSEKDICVWGAKKPTKAFVHIVGLESISSSANVIQWLQEFITTNTFVILDESSYIKGHFALRTARATALCKKAKYRTILTGTPISQGVEALYTQMYFLSPKILGYNSWYTFSRNHLVYSDKHKGLVVGSHRTDYLAAKIAPYIYQVTKQECLALPKKTYKRHEFVLTNEQQQAYDAAKDVAFDYIDNATDFADSPIWLFRLFGWLQQITCGFWNHPDKHQRTYEHYRIDVLRSCLPKNDKCIVWVKYLYSVDEISAALGDTAIALTGKQGAQERTQTLETWKTSRSQNYLIVTPGVGGHGLTLNEAHHAVFYTNDFKYSNRTQAEDRCHRIGQMHDVHYVDLYARRSIDERILDALDKKQNLADTFKRHVDAVREMGRKEARQAMKQLVSEL
jgi:SNF2 family DNA or RNA helicase